MRTPPAYDFSVIGGRDLDPDLAAELSRLFSSSYGRWSLRSPVNPGRQIRLGADYYLKNYARAPYRIAICRDHRRLVAQAIYVDKNTARGRVSLVVQLVVDEKYRRQGVATALLHAIWGFSDYYAWGIVTSSPCTVEALEGATFRRCKAQCIAKANRFIRRNVLDEIPFLRNADWSATDRLSMVNTGFYTDRRSKPIARKRVENRLGKLPEGFEWLALTFRSQPLDLEDAYSQIIDCSGKFVSEAYRRMPQSKQGWARHAAAEIDSLLRWLPPVKKSVRICDFGAGSGRHMMEFRRRGFANVEGIDFAPTDEGRQVGVQKADCRSWKSRARYDLILCLYDVIGSFPDERANLAILRNIVRHLAAGGYAVLSVSNAKSTDSSGVPLIDDSSKSSFLRSIFRMKPSTVMSTSGEFFDRNSTFRDRGGRYYHKEQFAASGSCLPSEYLVVDRRYDSGEIEVLLKRAGLRVIQRRFVRAGFESELSERMGKEILIIARQ